MSYLLDTHALLWWLLADNRLSRKAKSIIDDGDTVRFVSPVTAFEIANKVRIGKLDDARPLTLDFEGIVADARLSHLDITPAHALLAGTMAGEHKDPFDRILAAQAKLERLTIVSADGALDVFGVARLW